METVFLACFAFGALFTLVSVLLGAVSNLPGADVGHFGHLGHAAHNGPAGYDSAGGHLGHSGQSGQGGHAAHGGAHNGNGQPPAHTFAGALIVPLLNASSVLAFLTWFGAAGFVLTHFTAWPLLVAVAVAAASGLLAAFVIAAFLRKVLAGERVMNPADYRLQGTLARVTVTIPAGGVGEVVFAKAGVRRSEAARSASGGGLARGTEVVILRHERGVATVEAWQQLLGREPLDHPPPAEEAASTALPAPAADRQ